MEDGILFSWIGQHDLDAAGKAEQGPVLATLKAGSFQQATLLYNYEREMVSPYLDWLRMQTETPVEAHHICLDSPVHSGQIYEAARRRLNALSAPERADLSILLSPGTPAMHAVWILLGKTAFPCRFFQSSREKGVEEIDIPFALSAEYLPAASALDGVQVARLAHIEASELAAFDDIITRNPAMTQLKARGHILAQHDVPVLITGETGTGKELFARAIHNASPRANKPFIALNCGAIPGELVDSVLFGHRKGAFTGANSNQPGVFEQADGGSLFLDEFGELAADVQVRLLRVLQDGSFTPVGGQQAQRVNVRLITATHKDLQAAVADGHFREDLFYRVAVGVLHLPPLRQRDGDLLLLAEHLLANIATRTDISPRMLSVAARNRLLRHPWPGNVRELYSTLMRASLWCAADTISATELEQALFTIPVQAAGILDHDIQAGIDLDALCDEVQRHYIRQAVEVTGGNKSEAAQKLGIKNYQTLNNRMKKLNMG